MPENPSNKTIDRRGFLRAGAAIGAIAKRGASVNFPDFTRGKWKTNPPLGIVTG